MFNTDSHIHGSQLINNQLISGTAISFHDFMCFHFLHRSSLSCCSCTLQRLKISHIWMLSAALLAVLASASSSVRMISNRVRQCTPVSQAHLVQSGVDLCSSNATDVSISVLAFNSQKTTQHCFETAQFHHDVVFDLLWLSEPNLRLRANVHRLVAAFQLNERPSTILPVLTACQYCETNSTPRISRLHRVSPCSST